MKAIISTSFKQSLLLCFALFSFHIASAQKQDAFQCELVEEMPEFPGGMAALTKYLLTNLKCPENSDVDTCDRIVVRFVVNKSGKTEQIKIVRGCNNTALEAAVIKLIQDMPVWKPGKSHGEIIDCNYTLPVSIRWAE